MVKSELIKKSPIRVFEKSIHGGLGKGNIGVVASKEGVGKTACLVHIAVDKMLQDKKVIHVSFARKPEHVLNWYEDIFDEVAMKFPMGDATEVHNELIKNRLVMTFPQGAMRIPYALQTIESMIKSGHFVPDAVIIDSIDFYKIDKDDLVAIKSFADSVKAEVWVALTVKGEEPFWDDDGIPFIAKPYLDNISVLINIRHQGDYIHLTVAKDRETVGKKDMNLKLDPRTLLIADV